MPQQGNRAVPDIFVIGAMRSGTTTFCADLETHPHIFVPPSKEPWVLVRSHQRPHDARSMYRSLYANAPAGALLLDGSTSYTMSPTHPQVAWLAGDLSPGARLVYLVRNPVHRAISHYNHLLAWGIDHHTDIEHAVADDDSLIAYGRYWSQLQPWLEAFGPDAVRVIPFERYTANRCREVAEAVGWLGLEEDGLAIDEATIHNRSSSAKAVPRLWRSVLGSDLYQFRIKGRIPKRWRGMAIKRVLPAAPGASSRLSAATVDRIIDECADDARALSSFLGRMEPLWDWDATRREFA